MSDPLAMAESIEAPIRFGELTPEAVSAAFAREAARVRAELAALASAPDASAARVLAFLDADAPLETLFRLAEHMEEIGAGGDWPIAFEEVLTSREVLRAEVVGSPALLAHVERVAGEVLEGPDAMLLARARREGRKAGAGLDEAGRARLRAIDEELVTRTRAFTRRVDASSGAAAWVGEDASVLAGLPTWAVLASRAEANALGLRGHRLGLAMPIVNAVLAHAEDRGLRRAVYEAHVTRATEAGEDNRVEVAEILRLREERARLLGYAGFAELALDGAMLGSPAAVSAMLSALAEGLRAPLEAEGRALAALGAELGCAPVEAWDVAYLVEAARRRAREVDAEAVRPHLPLERALEGLRTLTAHLFGVAWEPVAAEVWHPSVTAWRVGVAGEPRAFVYLDLFAREGKRDGAWMTPIAPGHVVLVADLAEAGGLTVEELARVFHEVGHAMHHVLSRTKRATLSGTRVARDAVELPSTLLERLAREPAFLARLGVPAELAARRSSVASALATRLGLAVLDHGLHAGPAGGDPTARARDLFQPFVLAPLPDSYARVAALTHLFGGTDGYEASLYAYVWAEVLAADAHATFGASWEEWAAAGARFRDVVLARGAEVAPDALVHEFLGRPPSSAALLSEIRP